jgi:hypothetical protein
LFQKAVEAERIYDDPRLHEDPRFLAISVGEREQEEVYELAESLGEFMRAQKKLGNRTLPSVVRLFSRFMQGRVRMGHLPPNAKKRSMSTDTDESTPSTRVGSDASMEDLLMTMSY